MYTICVKHMVCPRCIWAVEQQLKTVGLPYLSVEMGKVHFQEKPDGEALQSLWCLLIGLGFEQVLSPEERLINDIKTCVLNRVYNEKGKPATTFSAYLSECLHQEYTYLSRTFSKVEGMTLEQYILDQKFKRARELLTYPDISIACIADTLEYSSTAHFSSQFKRLYGQSPSMYRKMELLKVPVP